VKRPPRVLAVTSAREAIQAALAHHGIADEVRGERVVTEWAELVGPRIAHRTRPDRIVDRVLWVEVATSEWLRELTLLKSQLLRGLLERLGEPVPFDDLRLRLASGPRRGAVTHPRGRRPPAAAPPPVRAATGAAREAIVREVAAVDDEELRELIARVRITNDR
jgi:predicted nucleic acid-binding Zn ribbon protein